MAGREEGGELATDAHESKPQGVCFELVPAPPMWPSNAKLLFWRCMWHGWYTRFFSRWCPEHHGVTPAEPAQKGRSQGRWGVGETSDRDEGAATPREARGEQDRSFSKKPAVLAPGEPAMPPSLLDLWGYGQCYLDVKSVTLNLSFPSNSECKWS